MKRALPLFATSLFALACPAFADEARCFANSQFLVIVQERTESAGTDILARTTGAIMPCTYSVADGDVVIGDAEDPLWFNALAGQYLILERSTGPEGNLVIYDLTRPEKPVLDLPAESHPIVLPQDVVFWAFDGEASVENCSGFAENTANGLGTMVTAETVFSLIDASHERTGRTRCIATQ